MATKKPAIAQEAPSIEPAPETPASRLGKVRAQMEAWTQDMLWQAPRSAGAIEISIGSIAISVNEQGVHAHSAEIKASFDPEIMAGMAGLLAGAARYIVEAEEQSS